MEKWEDKKDLVFSHVCLVGGVEKWEGGKLFYLVGEKSGRVENSFIWLERKVGGWKM